MRAGDARRAEVRHEGVAVDEALAVEVADVRRAVDGHGARDEVMMAPAEVVQALVLGRRHRDDRLDGRGEPAAVRCGEERRSEHQRRRCERTQCFDATVPVRERRARR